MLFETSYQILARSNAIIDYERDDIKISQIFQKCNSKQLH